MGMGSESFWNKKTAQKDGFKNSNARNTIFRMLNPNPTLDNVLITGATSGIGGALALEYATRGAKNIFICGRDEARLADVAEKCSMENVTVHPRILDVTDEAAVRSWILACDAVARLDLVIANAGIGTGDETEPAIRRMFDTNVGGVFNTVFPAIDVFADKATAGLRKRRQIAIVSSIAGYHGLPSCPAYSASKACVKAWGTGLRGRYSREGIWVNVICPGFVRSRITDVNTCPMPFFMEAEKAARIIAKRLERNVGLITFPWQMRLAIWFISMLPDCISMAIFNRLPEKA